MAMTRAEDLSTGRRVGALAFLLVGYFCYAWAWNTVDILRPYIRDAAGLTLQQSGLLYTVQAAGGLVGAIMMGQVADRIGRRNALMLALAGVGSLLLLQMAVTAPLPLLASRAGLGFFMGAMYPIVVGLYAGMFAPRTRGLIAGIVMGTYNVAVASLTFIAGQVIAAGMDWRLLYWLGVVPLAALQVTVWAIPDDRRLLAWGAQPGAQTMARKLPIAEMFLPAVRRKTLLLTAMTGLNFFAYQAFTGWATTYLKDVRALPADLIGQVLGVQFIAAALGGFGWGMLSDRFGRRAAAWGFVAAAALIPVYLFVPLSPLMFVAVGFAYGMMLSASAVWGPWLSELYPPHLRSTAASIFNWGRIVSMLAPIITGALVPALGMAPVMLMGSGAFLLAAAIWLSLPETMTR
ncbi:MFS transporter [Sandarakinorhabdus cyanobacteriorum]|nr:MFS transporter [Sandarakinorhabdus cyanobacteriorum]